MATLQDYAALDFYEEKQQFTGQDYVLGKDTESWVQELPYGESTPLVYEIETEAVIAPDAETASLSANVAVKLYRRDVLKFGNTLIVIAEDKEIGTAATSIAILPATAEVALAETALTYGMLPILSITEGGLPELTGTDAEAQNKVQGLWKARRTVGRDGSITLSGGMLRSDPSLPLLEKVGRGSRNLFYQSRHAPFTLFEGGFTEGAGPGAYSCVVSLTNNGYPAGGMEFVQVNYTFNFAGRPDLYTPLIAQNP